MKLMFQIFGASTENLLATGHITLTCILICNTVKTRLSAELYGSVVISLPCYTAHNLDFTCSVIATLFNVIVIAARQ